MKEFSGKFVLIDLWATWCAPCRMEMRYLPALHDYVDTLGNVVCLYLSIDENEEVWEKAVKDIPGIHLRVSEKMYADIKEKIYAGKSVSIPRYVLLSPTGEILHNDLIRPSNNIEKMKRQIAEEIKDAIK